MPPIAWLILAIVSAVGGSAVGWPAWRAYRARDARDTNSERYLAWRGRSPRGGQLREGMTGEERRRIYAGAALGLLALVALFAFFATS